MNTASTAAPAASRRAPAAASADPCNGSGPRFRPRGPLRRAGRHLRGAHERHPRPRPRLPGRRARLRAGQAGHRQVGPGPLLRPGARPLLLGVPDDPVLDPRGAVRAAVDPRAAEGRFTRNFAGYLPGAQVVFLDEIRKSNSGILNALLTALNERVFHDDGKPIRIPLVSMVCASNELPESESELSALYDRCLVRLVTKYVDDRDAFESMLFAPNPTAADDQDRHHGRAGCEVCADHPGGREAGARGPALPGARQRRFRGHRSTLEAVRSARPGSRASRGPYRRRAGGPRVPRRRPLEGAGREHRGRAHHPAGRQPGRPQGGG